MQDLVKCYSFGEKSSNRCHLKYTTFFFSRIKERGFDLSFVFFSMKVSSFPKEVDNEMGTLFLFFMRMFFERVARL